MCNGKLMIFRLPIANKAPIIEELTTRLKAVSEGRQHGGDEVSEGLGIKIVTVQIREALVSSQRLWQDLQTPFRHQQEKIARMSSLTMQQDIHQKELETKRLSETRETETMVAIEQIKETKKTEALELRLSQEDIRTAKEQESIRQDVKVEEETTAMQRDSEERLQNQSAKIEQTRKLAALQRTNEEMLKRTLLETETKSRQKSLLIEQELHVITEENRLAEKQVESQQKRLGEEATLKKLESENRLALQKQEDMLKQQIIESEIACQRKQHLNELESEREKLRLAQEKQVQEVEIARLRQEVRNSITHGDLSQQLIEQLPEIAAHMPKVQELKVLQTGHDDIVLNALSSFLMKMMALIENLGSTSHKESQS
ncbi:MAG: hypothetical protein B6242_09365 [Anaerolineaceae bacterium 4572_78]|nr:MAG: hypothetical protein B6242_09365 [Anaerolineaceae bacterium 4572_78]